MLALYPSSHMPAKPITLGFDQFYLLLTAFPISMVNHKNYEMGLDFENFLSPGRKILRSLKLSEMHEKIG